MEFTNSEGTLSDRGFCTVFYDVSHYWDGYDSYRFQFIPVRISLLDMLSAIPNPVIPTDPRIKRTYLVGDINSLIPIDGFEWVEPGEGISASPQSFSINLDTNEIQLF